MAALVSSTEQSISAISEHSVGQLWRDLSIRCERLPTHGTRVEQVPCARTALGSGRPTVFQRQKLPNKAESHSHRQGNGQRPAVPQGLSQSQRRGLGLCFHDAKEMLCLPITCPLDSVPGIPLGGFQKQDSLSLLMGMLLQSGVPCTCFGGYPQTKPTKRVKLGPLCQGVSARTGLPCPPHAAPAHPKTCLCTI